MCIYSIEVVIKFLCMYSHINYHHNFSSDFKGRFCEKSKDDCAAADCGKAECIDAIGRSYCQCMDRTKTGINCDIGKIAPTLLQTNHCYLKIHPTF